MKFLAARIVILTVLVLPQASSAQTLPSIAEKTEGLVHMDGFFPLYWDEAEGKVWMEIPRLDEAFLYVVSLPAGLGSNDVGLDRGQLGGERIVRFERVGPKVLLVEPNLRYRAESSSAAERRSVEDAFAGSVVWGFPIAAEAPTEDGEAPGRLLVDATAFIVRDAHGVVRRLQQSGQGTFRLDMERSTPHLEMTKAFPKNTEMEARLTFVSDNPGGYVREVAADPYAVTLRVRHSFVELPPPGFEPRPLDPRSGYFGVEYVDYATPIGERMVKQYVARHRLEKKDPTAAISEPVEPIVYYLDPGTPEPVRSALLDGARWWNEAFEAAGYRDAFRVEMLPEDADPMDVRYNVIQWVHRSTRGWSYGASVTDPRTGEIIKGHVTLGSLRVRQDYLLAEGLLAPYGDPATRNGLPPENDPMLRMALARLRQLSAHEVGHTLGIAHNFAASINDRASVMDYPAPFATLTPDGHITLDEAYDTGIGEWDKLAVRYGYTDFPPATNEPEALASILDEMHQQGYLYLTDADARPPGAANPLANLWDNGSNALEALGQEMAVRRVALANFGLASIREDRPLATLEEVLVPLYLRHRYAVEAATKLIGGVEYRYALRGDAQPLPAAIPSTIQRMALDSLLATLHPEVLALPPNVRTQIPPRPPGYGQTRELFGGHTGLTFDAYAPAEAAATMVFSFLIHPERAARLVYQQDFNPDLPDLTEVLRTTSSRVWEADVPQDPYEAELQRVVQITWTDALLDLAAQSGIAPAVKARTLQHLRDLHVWLAENPGRRRDPETIAHRALAFDEIDKFLFRLYRPEERPEPLPIPPGQPIGQGESSFQHRHRARQAFLEQWNTAERCAMPGW